LRTSAITDIYPLARRVRRRINNEPKEKRSAADVPAGRCSVDRIVRVYFMTKKQILKDLITDRMIESWKFSDQNNNRQTAAKRIVDSYIKRRLENELIDEVVDGLIDEVIQERFHEIVLECVIDVLRAKIKVMIGCEMKHKRIDNNLLRKLDRIFSANVRDHRHLPVARSVPGEERAQARSVTRVGVRWIALFGLFSFLSDKASAGKILGKNLHFLIPGRKASLWKIYFAGLTPPRVVRSNLKFRCVSQKYISAKLAWSASV
jgi:hypothetical protein